MTTHKSRLEISVDLLKKEKVVADSKRLQRELGKALEDRLKASSRAADTLNQKIGGFSKAAKGATTSAGDWSKALGEVAKQAKDARGAFEKLNRAGFNGGGGGGAGGGGQGRGQFFTPNRGGNAAAGAVQGAMYGMGGPGRGAMQGVVRGVMGPGTPHQFFGGGFFGGGFFKGNANFGGGGGGRRGGGGGGGGGRRGGFWGWPGAGISGRFGALSGGLLATQGLSATVTGGLEGGAKFGSSIPGIGAIAGPMVQGMMAARKRLSHERMLQSAASARGLDYQTNIGIHKGVSAKRRNFEEQRKLIAKKDAGTATPLDNAKLQSLKMNEMVLNQGVAEDADPSVMKKHLSTRGDQFLKNIQHTGEAHGFTNTEMLGFNAAARGAGLLGEEGQTTTIAKANRAFNISGQTTAQVLYGGETGGMVGVSDNEGATKGIQRGHDRMARTLANAVRMGVTNAELPQAMNMVATQVTAMRQTGIPLKMGALTTMGARNNYAGIGGMRGMALGINTQQAIARKGTQGPESLTDMEMLRAFARPGEDITTPEGMNRVRRRMEEGGKGYATGMRNFRKIVFNRGGGKMNREAGIAAVHAKNQEMGIQQSLTETTMQVYKDMNWKLTRELRNYAGRRRSNQKRGEDVATPEDAGTAIEGAGLDKIGQGRTRDAVRTDVRQTNKEIDDFGVKYMTTMQASVDAMQAHAEAVELITKSMRKKYVDYVGRDIFKDGKNVAKRNSDEFVSSSSMSGL